MQVFPYQVRLMGRLQKWYHAHKKQWGGGVVATSFLENGQQIPCGGQALMETQ